MATSPNPLGDRLDAWLDGGAICVIAAGAYGDPLDLAEHEVERFIEKLQRLLLRLRAAGESNDAA